MVLTVLLIVGAVNTPLSALAEGSFAYTDSFEGYDVGTSMKHTDNTTDFPVSGQWGGIKTAGYRGKTVAGTFYDNEGNEHTQYATGSYSDDTTVTVSSDYAYSGSKSLYFSGAAWAFGSSIENVTPGKTYTLSYRIKRDPTVTDRTTLKAAAVLTTLNIGMSDNANADFRNHICNLFARLALTTKTNIDLSSDNWELVSMEFTVPENAANLNTVYFVIDSSGNVATTVNQFYIDDLAVFEKEEEVNLNLPIEFYNAKGEKTQSQNAYAETEYTVNDDNTVNLKVKYTESFAYEFMGWYNANGDLVSKEKELKNISSGAAKGYTAKIKDTNIYRAASYEGYNAGKSLTHTDTSTPFPVNGQWGGFAWAGYRKQTVAGTVYDNKGGTYNQVSGGTYANGVTATVSDSYAHSGTKSLLLSGAYWTMVGGIENVKAGKTYELSFWVKKDPTLVNAVTIKGIAVLTTVNIGQSGIPELSDHISNRYSTFGLPWNDGKYSQSAVDVSSGNWVQIATRFTVPETATGLDTVYLCIDASGVSDTSAETSRLYIDDICVSEVFDGIQTAYNGAAAIRTASASSTNKNGLRIYNKIEREFIEDYGITEYGSIAALSSELSGDLTLENKAAIKGVAYNSVTKPDAVLFEQTEKANIYTSYLTNIPFISYGDEYVIRAYAIDGTGAVYYGEPTRLSVYDVAYAIDNGDALTEQTEEDKDAFTVFAGGFDGEYTMYDNWLKTELKFAGKLRTIAKAEDTLSGNALTKALETDGYYEPFFERAIANEGNRAMLKAMFEKAERGEDITVVGFGGSITQKAACTNETDSYSYLVAQWLRNKFPNIKVNWYNAGIGSTTSVLGIARMNDHVLAHNPDLVIVDFTTNDQTDDYHAGSYEAILRTLYEKQIAFVTIAFGNVNKDEYKNGIYHKGGNREAIHGPVMLYNDAPVIDYYGVMWDCYLDANGDEYNESSDAAHWNILWNDYIHPTVKGHKLAANAINYYLGKVYDDMDNITETVTYPKTPHDSYTENFMGAMMYGNANIDCLLTDSSNVTIGTYNNYDSTTVSNWTIWQIGTGGYVEFTIDKCKMFALMSINSSSAPVAKIYINGTLVKTHTAYQSSGELNWMNFIKFFEGNDTVTVKIECTSGTYRITSALIAQNK